MLISKGVAVSIPRKDIEATFEVVGPVYVRNEVLLNAGCPFSDRPYFL